MSRKKLKISLDKPINNSYNEDTEQMFGKRRQKERIGKIMSSGFVLLSIFEFAVAAFIIYGLFNEEKFAECERKFFGSLFRSVKKTFSGQSFQRQ